MIFIKHTLLPALAVALVATSMADTSAEAKSLKKRNGWHAATTSKLKAPPRQRRAHAKSRRLRALSGGNRNPAANTAAHIHALTVYLQWRKCLDNMLPKCP